jgi:hypothetical protein
MVVAAPGCAWQASRISLPRTPDGKELERTMILLLALAVAFAVGILRGGRLSRLALLSLRWPALPVLAFAAQAGVIFFPVSRGQELWYGLHAGILLLSYLALLLMVWVNRRVPGMALLGLGLLLNLVVMLANGGYMPITPETMHRIGYSDQVVQAAVSGDRLALSKDIVLPREQTRLWVLSDVFAIPPPFFLPSAFSLGDVLVMLGAFLVVQWALVGPAAAIESGMGSRNPGRTNSGKKLPGCIGS